MSPRRISSRLASAFRSLCEGSQELTLSSRETGSEVEDFDLSMSPMSSLASISFSFVEAADGFCGLLGNSVAGFDELSVDVEPNGVEKLVDGSLEEGGRPVDLADLAEFKAEKLFRPPKDGVF